MEEKDIKKRLVELLEKSYSPYSNFPVASIVIDENDNYYEGVNVENKAYPSSLCAERNAITTAITGGMKKIKKIYVIADIDIPISPCGACRQVMSEFSTKDTEIILYGTKTDDELRYNEEEILPYSFKL
ncbi:cytidine deaminase [Oceanivirga miroungae]|uniref:Cytidine deaminase n=1 Tax=Oceanivirga miroungae TaxID=1130046 RepID=A0A6I8MAL4_9FUSO|nr:cytidine deaminase [Oceanivirga miroungae]VWL85348.1 cytidine deaminase [Oceanivirga miroungae]